MKGESVFLAFISSFLVLTQEKETKESQASAGGVFIVRRRAGKGCLGENRLLLFVGKMRVESVFLAFHSPFLVLTGGKETKESQTPAGGGFLCSSAGGDG